MQAVLIVRGPAKVSYKKRADARAQVAATHANASAF